MKRELCESIEQHMYLHARQNPLCTKLVILGNEIARKNRSQRSDMLEKTYEIGGLSW